MKEEKRRPDEGDDNRKAAVNPAARRDPATSPPADPAAHADEKQVPPVQEEPLDPLGPGGIGA